MPCGQHCGGRHLHMRALCCRHLLLGGRAMHSLSGRADQPHGRPVLQLQQRAAPQRRLSVGVLGTSSITCVPPLLSFSRSRQAVLSDQGWGKGDQKLLTLYHYPLPNQHPLLVRNECDAGMCCRSWTVLNQAGGIGNWFLTTGGPSASGSGKVDPAGISGQYAVTGQIGPGAHALISTAHLVAPGETLSLNFFANNVISFQFNDTMSFNAFNNQQAGQCFVAGPVQPALPVYVLVTLLRTLSERTGPFHRLPAAPVWLISGSQHLE